MSVWVTSRLYEEPYLVVREVHVYLSLTLQVSDTGAKSVLAISVDLQLAAHQLDLWYGQ